MTLTFILILFFITTAATAKQQDETTVAVPTADSRDEAIVYLTARRDLWRHRARVRGHVIHRLWHQIRELREQAQRSHATSSPSTGVPASWLQAALCVHRGEGSWTDPNPPYYGGMQMDDSFMRHYGAWALARWGTADHWPISVQLSVAYAGWKVQGWGAWPNTARACGLL